MHLVVLFLLLVGTIFLLTRLGQRKGNGNTGGASMTSTLEAYTFLKHMMADEHYPSHLVAKGQRILKQMCMEIEVALPENETELFEITHKATRRFNDLEVELEESGSELETIARENIAEDVAFVLDTYGLKADLEEALAPRTW